MPSSREAALRSLLIVLIALLFATILVFAASLYCFVQLGRLSALLEQGLNASILQYPSDSAVKARVDMLQMEYSCCGDLDYSDWFHVPWIPRNILVADQTELHLYLLESSQEDPTRYNDYTNDDVPFSCCDPTSPRPCIHHHVTVESLHYQYSPYFSHLTLHRTGCRQALEDFFGKKLLLPLALSLLLMTLIQVVILVLFRILLTSMQMAVAKGDMTGPGEAHLFRPEQETVQQEENRPPIAEDADEKWALLGESEDVYGRRDRRGTVGTSEIPQTSRKGSAYREEPGGSWETPQTSRRRSSAYREGPGGSRETPQTSRRRSSAYREGPGGSRETPQTSRRRSSAFREGPGPSGRRMSHVNKVFQTAWEPIYENIILDDPNQILLVTEEEGSPRLPREELFQDQVPVETYWQHQHPRPSHGPVMFPSEMPEVNHVVSHAPNPTSGRRYSKGFQSFGVQLS
ncbi:uncharacterized protein LOC143296470 isoform X2 [Babylonia areolata]|uniref:uncharacterized protein LOC143296470 isoform X2 n=1 Tax=Babylonia areolata TaxID=304850 RepID=UPI003FD63F34